MASSSAAISSSNPLKRLSIMFAKLRTVTRATAARMIMSESIRSVRSTASRITPAMLSETVLGSFARMVMPVFSVFSVI